MDTLLIAYLGNQRLEWICI